MFQGESRAYQCSPKQILSGTFSIVESISLLEMSLCDANIQSFSWTNLYGLTLCVGDGLNGKNVMKCCLQRLNGTCFLKIWCQNFICSMILVISQFFKNIGLRKEQFYQIIIIIFLNIIDLVDAENRLNFFLVIVFIVKP